MISLTDNRNVMNMNKKFLLLFFLTISLGFLHTAIAQTTWTNGGGDNLWSNDLNWSNGVPSSGDDAIFDGTSSDDCIIDIDAECLSLSMGSAFSAGQITSDEGYSLTISDACTIEAGTLNVAGAIYFGAGSVNISGGSLLIGSDIEVDIYSFNISGGLFNGGDATEIRIGAIGMYLTISGGTFICPSNILKIANPQTGVNRDLITFTGGTFNHNSGTVILELSSSSSNRISTGLIFNNLKISNLVTSNRTLNIGANVTVLGNLELISGTGTGAISFGNGGNIYLHGTLNNYNNEGTGNTTSNSTINLIASSGIQNIIANSSNTQRGKLPHIKINQSGTASLVMTGFINVAGSWEYTGGRPVDATGSTVTIFGTRTILANGMSFNDLNVGHSGVTANITLSSGLSVSGTLNIISGASLNTSNNSVELSGNVINSGVLTLGTSVVTLRGGAGQSIDLRGASDVTLHTLVCNKTSGTAIITDNISISDLLTCSGGTLDLNDRVRLLSTASKTAQVGTITGGTINGNATIERYIPAKATRKWHFLAAPVSSGASIRNSWQNQIYITGAGTGSGPVGTFNSNFFDWTVANSTSMYSYNENMNVGMNNRWVSVPNTNATNLNRGVGYRVFIRGARGDLGQLTGTVSNQTEVTLAATGNIPQGTQNISITCSNGCTADDGWNLIGNPFPATLDWNLMSTTNSSITTGTYYVLDPINNAYVSWNGSVGGATRYISSGQSFWVKKSSSGSSNFQVTEAHKAVNQNGGSFFKTDNLSNLLTIKLTGTGFENNAYVHLNNSGLYTLDRYDAYKLSFGNNQIATFISEDGTRLDINNLPEYGAKLIDTIEVDVKLPLAANNYTLNFNNVSSFDNALQVVLEDKLSNTYTDLKSNAVYAFTTNGNANSANNRFRILISNQSTPLPVTLTLLQAKLENNLAVLNWSTLTEKNNAKFIVEHSVDGISYRKVGEVKGAGNSSIKVDYAFNHSKFSRNEVNYYRLKQVDYNGDFAYSNVAFVSGSTKQITPEFNNESGSTKLSLYPIPAQNVLSVEGLLTEQAWVRISNMYGVEVYTKQVKANNGIAALDIEHLTAGVYVIEVKDENGNVEVMKFTKQ
jgi:hypothetical protein